MTSMFNFAIDNKEMPLKLRKNIKDQGENVLQDFLITIQTTTGVEFKFEVYGDIVAFNTAISSSYEHRLGEIFYGSSGLLQELKSCLITGCADDMMKQALVTACTSKTIAFRVNLKDRPSGGAYHPLSIENGTLFVDFYQDAVWSNSSDVAYTKIEDITGIDAASTASASVDPNAAFFDFTVSNTSLPLKLRKNLKEQGDNALQDFLSSIQSATGIAFTFEVHGDLLAFNKAISSTYENRLGEIFYGSSGVMPCLVTCLKNGCGDDMIKEALEDACSSKLLVFRLNLSDRPGGGEYHPLSVKDGVFYVDFYQDAVWSNVDDVTYTKLEDMPGM